MVTCLARWARLVKGVLRPHPRWEVAWRRMAGTLICGGWRLLTPIRRRQRRSAGASRFARQCKLLALAAPPPAEVPLPLKLLQR